MISYMIGLATGLFLAWLVTRFAMRKIKVKEPDFIDGVARLLQDDPGNWTNGGHMDYLIYLDNQIKFYQASGYDWTLTLPVHRKLERDEQDRLKKAVDAWTVERADHGRSMALLESNDDGR